MRFFKYSLIFVIFIGISCQDVKHVSKPNNLIPQDKMVDILTEIVLVNSARNYNKVMLEKSGIKPNQYIYQKFAIDSVQFEKSNEYYSENYNDYVSIFDKVKDSLDALKEHYNKLTEEEKKIEDSLNKIKLDKNRPDLKKEIDSIEVEVDSIAKDSADAAILDSIKAKETTRLRKATR
ncbi:DUF4296 domain-containing protein [Zunongwangia endophytica]|uniref:DUF4296 domain-containing protein n=1 Tax=Zunongwangia endophytica TaxID=1808945 RepID=A0ABV8H616_9FLAO|nr:DUF4296 domain-containing protein [Zunongwangia endophytica]MDN3596194.1 DUF4296 domain-containing protein [Zunongwangia endophytica]